MRRMMSRWNKAALLLAGTAGIMCAGAIPASASAGPAPSQPSPVTIIKIPMHIVLAPPPPNVSPYASKYMVIPANQVYGPCGYSYIYINNAGRGDANINYGFHTYKQGYDYFSQTFIYGASRYSSVTNSGWLGFLGEGSQDYSNTYEAYLGVGTADGTATMWSYLGGNYYCYSGALYSANYIS